MNRITTIRTTRMATPMVVAHPGWLSARASSRVQVAASKPIRYSRTRPAIDSTPESSVTVTAVELLAPRALNCRNDQPAETAPPAGKELAIAVAE
jgi:hypothetical protein